jgi:hypothetical protein
MKNFILGNIYYCSNVFFERHLQEIKQISNELNEINNYLQCHCLDLPLSVSKTIVDENVIEDIETIHWFGEETKDYYCNITFNNNYNSNFCYNNLEIMIDDCNTYYCEKWNNVENNVEGCVEDEDCGEEKYENVFKLLPKYGTYCNGLMLLYIPIPSLYLVEFEYLMKQKIGDYYLQNIGTFYKSKWIESCKMEMLKIAKECELYLFFMKFYEKVIKVQYPKQKKLTKNWFETKRDTFLRDIIEDYILQMVDERQSSFIGFEEEWQQRNIENVLMCEFKCEQKSVEWFKKRENVLTASNIVKILGSGVSKKRFIEEKCTDDNKQQWWGVSKITSLEKGNKFEEVSAFLFAKHFLSSNNAKLIEVGLIIHPDIPYLSASPDRIIKFDENHCALLEIKNIENREINGIPKDDYWVQMQTQMEVCNINICYFLETEFIVVDLDSWLKNDFQYYAFEERGASISYTDCQQKKAVYLHYYFADDDIGTFIKNIQSKTKELDNVRHYCDVSYCFWYLKHFNLLSVKRNKKWFQSVLPEFDKTWQEIAEKRQSNGFLSSISFEKKMQTQTQTQTELLPIKVVKLDCPLEDDK